MSDAPARPSRPHDEDSGRHDRDDVEPTVGLTPEEIERTAEETELTPEEEEARRLRANRACRGALAALLCLEAFVVLLVPRAIAQTSTGLDTTKTVLLIALAVVLVVVGAMLRRPWGIAVGSALQLIVLATGLWERTLFIIAACFIALWLYVLNLRHELVGTPGGARMLYSP